MSKMKSMLGLAAMMTALAYRGNSGTTPDFYNPKENEEERKARLKAATEKQNKAKGLTKFVIQGIDIWALNESNAIRKFKKLTV